MVTRLTCERRQLFFSGNVQGVGFRYTTERLARGYNITGFVRNLPDGRVELVVEGPSGQLDGLLEQLSEQMAGHVRSVDCDVQQASDAFAGFGIRY